MKSDRILITISILAMTILLAVLPALADTPNRSPRTTQFEPGNYCVSCHSPGDERLATVTNWAGSIEREAVSGCAAASQVHEDLYYTERLLLAIDRARTDIPTRLDATKTDARVAAARETYSRMLDTPVSSLDAIISEGSVLRYQLGKSYNWLNQTREAVKRQEVFIAAVVATVVLLVSLGWGLSNIKRFSLKGRSHFRLGAKAIAFVVFVFILFALPIFRVPAQEVAGATEEELARQTSLDNATRAADASDRALARSWMLTRVGAAWTKTNPQAADDALTDALTGVAETQQNVPALWGETHAAYEGTVGSPIDQEKAGLIASRLNATNARVWNLRLIATEWTTVDPARAEAILEQALKLATSQSGFYRDLDVRGLAVAWAAIDPEQGMAVAGRIYDPALRAWALWEIADISGDTSLYDQAAEAAREVTGALDQARALRQIAVHSGDQTLFAEALAALDEIEGAALAYALSDLAAASGDAAIAAQIDPAYPDARAAALYRLGQFDEAWAAAVEIVDPFDQARAQATIAGVWGNVDAATQIADPTLRDLALRNIAIAKEDIALAADIESPYYRVQALTGLKQYQAAFESAEALNDTYPLRALAVAWAETDPQSALAVVDLMDRETDKAEALRAIAAATGDEAHFERALNLALAARVRGDALAPAEASLNLAKVFDPIDGAKAEAAFNQAYDVAAQISTKYK